MGLSSHQDIIHGSTKCINFQVSKLVEEEGGCMALSSHRNNRTRKNLLYNIGSLTWYKPLSCDTTNSESRHTSRERTPCRMASHRSSITTLYSTTLFEDGRKHTPPEDNI